MGAEVSIEHCRTFWNLLVEAPNQDGDDDIRVLDQHIGHYPNKEEALAFLRGIVLELKIPEVLNIGR